MKYNSVSDYQRQLIEGTLTCKEAVDHYLSQIETNKHLNAFVDVYKSESIARAIALDEKRRSGAILGKLHGVIVALKDVICYEGHKVTAASAILENFISVYSSTVVDKLLSEEAIIIGNCNCDEFAMGSTNENSVYGSVKNALDINKVPGGSSGGSAVAVQASMCMVSLGSDTGGSVRQPADFCGVLGMKPGYGTISRHGLLAYASSFDQVGIFAKNVNDIEIVLDVISGPDQYDSTANAISYKEFPEKNNKGKYRIAVLKNAMNYPGLDGEIKENINVLAEKLKEDGNVVEAINFDLIDFIVPAYYILTTAEASSNLSRYDGIRYGYRQQDAEDLSSLYKRSRGNGFSKEVKKRIMLGTFVLSEGYFDAYYTKAQQVRQLLVQQTEDIFEKFDAIILPTSPSTAFEAGSMQKDPIAMYLADIYTVYANLTGIPGISLPLFKHSNGMPFGVQVLTNKQNELTLLRLSELFLDKYKLNS